LVDNRKFKSGGHIAFAKERAPTFVAVMLPKTKYAHSSDICIAYQISGDGPFDVVWAPGTMSHLDREIPRRALFFERRILGEGRLFAARS
jgi:hypothetical protein